MFIRSTTGFIRSADDLVFTDFDPVGRYVARMIDIKEEVELMYF